MVIDGNEGLVIAFTARATILMTPDGNHLRLPNALVFRRRKGDLVIGQNTGLCVNARFWPIAA